MVLFFIILFALALAGVNVYLYRRAKKADGPEPDEALVKRALTIIWVKTYGQKLETLPSIIWVTGKALDCANGTGWKDSLGRCVAGLTWVENALCKVGWVEGELLSDTALAHELGHYYLYLIGQPTDGDHTGPFYAFGGLKDLANGNLRVVGL